MHNAFGDNRINPRREFFCIDPERVVAALKLASLEEVTIGKDIVDSKEDQHALDIVREKLSTFNFDMVNISPGAELVFSRDENIKAYVVNNRWIQFNGVETSLSEAARQVL